ncbi:MAG: peptidylprolyl isomerase [Acidimicrobiales bacterium]
MSQKGRRPQPSKQVRQQAAQAARRRRAQRQRVLVSVVTSAILVLGVSVFVAGGSGGKKVETAANSSTVPSRTPVVLSPAEPGASISGDTTCPKADGSSERTTAFAKPPPMCINPSRAYSAEVRTTKGSFVIALDPKAAPKTVNNFVVLARYRYFEGIPFHRIVPGFVVQGGDPKASGLGNPGYKIEDELPKVPYKIGSVAMANSGPNTNGSQFFIVTGEAGAGLPPQYSLFGEVTEGMDAVRQIEAVGTPPTATDPGGQPTEVVTILSVAIRET